MDISSDIPSATDQTGSAVLQLDLVTTATMDSSYQHLLNLRSSKIAAPPPRILPNGQPQAGTRLFDHKRDPATCLGRTRPVDVYGMKKTTKDG